MNVSSAPAKDSAGTQIQSYILPLAQIQLEAAQATSTAQNDSGSNRIDSTLREKQMGVAKSAEIPQVNRSLRTIFQQDCQSMIPASPSVPIPQVDLPNSQSKINFPVSQEAEPADGLDVSDGLGELTQQQVVDRAVSQLRYLDLMHDQNTGAARMPAVPIRNARVSVSTPCTLSTTPSILIPVVSVTGTTIQCPLAKTLLNSAEAAPPPIDLQLQEIVTNPADNDQEEDEIPEWCKTLDPTFPITLSTTCPVDLYPARERMQQTVQSSKANRTTLYRLTNNCYYNQIKLKFRTLLPLILAHFQIM